MRLPKWVAAWLTDAGVPIDEFLTFVTAAVAKIDLPTELSDTIALWVQEHVKKELTGGVILGFATLLVAELKSGRPGYDPGAIDLN